MKILVFSDSHGSSFGMQKAVETHQRLGKIDSIFYLGDGLHDITKIHELYPSIPIHAVYGNCDLGIRNNPVCPSKTNETTVKIGAFSFLLTHGHFHDVKYGYQRIADYAIAKNIDVVCFGHTHRSEDITIDGSSVGSVRMINPGTANGRFNSTYAVVEIIGPQLVCGFGVIN